MHLFRLILVHLMLRGESGSAVAARIPKRAERGLGIQFLDSPPTSGQNSESNCRDLLQSCRESVQRGYCRFGYYERYCCQSCTSAQLQETTSTTTTTSEKPTTTTAKPKSPQKLYLPGFFFPEDEVPSTTFKPLIFNQAQGFILNLPTSNENNKEDYNAPVPNSGFAPFTPLQLATPHQTTESPLVSDSTIGLEHSLSTTSRTTVSSTLEFLNTTMKPIVTSVDTTVAQIDSTSSTKSTLLTMEDKTSTASDSSILVDSTPNPPADTSQAALKNCRTPSEVTGVCIELKYCEVVIEAIRTGLDYNLCGFDGGTPIACCPPQEQYRNVPGCGIRTASVDDVRGVGQLSAEATSAENDDFRILGGKVSESHSWPWMVILAYEGEADIIAFCSGVLISDKFVLTASHCVQEPEPFIVRLGEHDYRYTNETFPSEDVKVEKIFLHPGYDYDRGYHDLALIKLSVSIETNREHIRPICLPWGDKSTSNLIGKGAVVTGWGVQQYGGQPSSVLREVLIEVFDAKRCLQSYATLRDFKTTWPRGMTDKHIICAGTYEGGKDACQGDSGGPLVISNYKSIYTLVGIVSKGFGCGFTEFPGLYAPITNHEHLQWIKTIAFVNSSIGELIQA